MIIACPHALVSSDVTRNKFTTNCGLTSLIAVTEKDVWASYRCQMWNI